MRLSKSGLLKYIACPKNFEYDYVMGLRKDRPDPPDDSPMVKGSRIHKIFEDYYKLPEAKEVEPDYVKNIYDILLTMPYARMYDKHMRHFAQFNAQQIMGGDNIMAKGVEGYIPKEMETTYYNEALNIIGIIDRVDEEENGFRVVDYKSGQDKPIMSFPRDKTKPPVDNYMFELSYYAFLYELETKNDVYDAGIFFSKTNNFRIVEITEADKERALDKILDIKKLIDAKHFPTLPSHWCRNCDNSKICTAEFLEEYM
jgi:CRISPR/Cas system-associated exonuclease Cas4 (RecB family)